jgi:hypothetical protein
VRELDVSFSPKLNARLDVLRWESRTYPAFGDDTQAIVTEQMGDDYDIFIGVLWQRFGSPTPRAESGTIEEFQRALRRYERDPHSVEIMFYFKDAEAHSSSIDLDQMQRVCEFRKHISRRARLGSFKTTEEFTSHIRMNLIRVITDKALAEALPADEKAESLGGDREAFVDQLEQSQKNLDLATEIARQIPGRMQELGGAIIADEFTKIGVKSASIKLAQRLKSVATKIMRDVRVLHEVFGRGIDAIQQTAKHFPEFSGSPEYDLHRMAEVLRLLVETIKKSAAPMTSMSEAIDAIPDTALPLKRAKREVRIAIEELQDELLAESRLAEGASLMYNEISSKLQARMRSV